MGTSNDALIPGFLLGLIVGGVLFLLVAINLSAAQQKEAIEHGYAQHNPTTGDWEWIKKGTQ